MLFDIGSLGFGFFFFALLLFLLTASLTNGLLPHFQLSVIAHLKTENSRWAAWQWVWITCDQHSIQIFTEITAFIFTRDLW